MGVGLSAASVSSTRIDAIVGYDDGAGPAVYFGGNFTTAGGQPANSIAKWNGSAWLPVGTGLNAWVHALAVYDVDGAGANPPALFAGGDFTAAGGTALGRIGRWNGTAWSSIGSLTLSVGTPTCNALLPWDDGGEAALYVGSSFTSAGALRPHAWRSGTVRHGRASGRALTLRCRGWPHMMTAADRLFMRPADF